MAVGLILVPAVAPAAVGAGDSVREPPRITGPLELTYHQCSGQAGKSGPGSAVATCYFSYAPIGREDTTDPFPFVEWRQFSVTPGDGQCLRVIRGRITVEGARLTGLAPAETPAAPRRVKLRVGGFDQPVSVTKQVSLGGGRLVAERRRSPASDQLVWRWRGRSTEEVKIAFGGSFEPRGVGASVSDRQTIGTQRINAQHPCRAN